MAAATSALVVKPPFAAMLVTGTKRWELRSTRTRVGRRVCIAESGSSTLLGEVTISAVFNVECLPLPLEEYQCWHKVPKPVLEMMLANYKAMYVSWLTQYSIPHPRDMFIPRELLCGYPYTRAKWPQRSEKKERVTWGGKGENGIVSSFSLLGTQWLKTCLFLGLGWGN